MGRVVPPVCGHHLLTSGTFQSHDGDIIRAVATGCRAAPAGRRAAPRRLKAPAPTRAVGGAARTAAAVLMVIGLPTMLLVADAGAAQQACAVAHAAAAVPAVAAAVVPAVAAAAQGLTAGVQHSVGGCDAHCLALERFAINTLSTTIGAAGAMRLGTWLLQLSGLDSTASAREEDSATSSTDE
ncbi:hypothetical protein C2E21_1244 [Chlorella sorokiniana]|uniref:Uncharacterized protein n=1 Tax=Chlorella sorokiniana TaxID=3076 RepID=A0A2P6U2F8_CHLSO|nr:hypothetical protein C2E21_1244 [Chlorella sorokiniana]|eukprot:PRW60496.1 hypothetical protein C2E21_1244 [Chlorella sorokiniana]